jgi:hypothetical protein
MKTIERLPKFYKLHKVPNKMITDCRYASSQMIVNGASSIVGSLSQLIIY